jgi:hypothetical protein
MEEIDSPEWQEVLAQAEMPARLKQSFEITIRWYLSFCRCGRGRVGFESARDFIEWAAREKQPQDWNLEQWKEGIRWFFRTAKERSKRGREMRDKGPETAQESVWMPEERSGWPEWKVEFLTVVRRRKYD